MFANPAPIAPAAPVKVLIVDDSAVVRQVLARELSRHPGLRVVATASDPYVARDRIVEFDPDVLTLDVEMPRMDGITFLRRLMAHHPLPVVVVSSLAGAGTQTAIDAMVAGAVDVVAKPGSAYSVEQLGPVLARKLLAAAGAKFPPRPTSARPLAAVQRGPARADTSMVATTDKVIAIGASTGGVQALTEVLTGLPATIPGIVLVQHMPPRFTASFAERLNAMCGVEVREAADGDSVIPGRVLIAPGGRHMRLQRSGARYHVKVIDGPEVDHQRPSVGVLFDSVAKYAGPNAVGAILTGMGDDGAQGLLNMRRAGARTLAQDEATSVVFGMPMEAIRCGAAERVTALPDVAGQLIQMAGHAG